MSTVKQSIKKITPEPLWNAARTTWDALGNAGESVSAAVHPWRRASAQRLQKFKDYHKGERCFIIGNGPSLKQTDLMRLRGEYTFGMNRFYLAFPELGFTTSYFLCINSLVIEQSAEDLQMLPIPKFFSWRARKWLKPDTNLHFLYTTYTGPKFSQDASERLWEGGTVTYTALQLAFHMGFETVILIGVDHNYTTQGKANATVVSTGDDPNHFDPHYFGKGFRWQLPDLESWDTSYRMARQVYETAGRRVLDATIGGKLTVFPKVDYNSLF
jgi:hypothetical protein